jgi:hypothetical protein
VSSLATLALRSLATIREEPSTVNGIRPMSVVLPYSHTTRRPSSSISSDSGLTTATTFRPGPLGVGFACCRASSQHVHVVTKTEFLYWEEAVSPKSPRSTCTTTIVFRGLAIHSPCATWRVFFVCLDKSSASEACPRPDEAKTVKRPSAGYLCLSLSHSWIVTA